MAAWRTWLKDGGARPRRGRQERRRGRSTRTRVVAEGVGYGCNWRERWVCSSHGRDLKELPRYSRIQPRVCNAGGRGQTLAHVRASPWLGTNCFPTGQRKNQPAVRPTPAPRTPSSCPGLTPNDHHSPTPTHLPPYLRAEFSFAYAPGTAPHVNPPTTYAGKRAPDRRFMIC